MKMKPTSFANRQAAELLSCALRPLLVAALALATTAKGQTAVPPEFQDLASQMSARLDAFDAKLAAEWDGSRHPVVPAATLLSANGNRGLQLLAPGVLEGVRIELDRLGSLGVRAVAVSVNYPVLDPAFLAESGHPEAHEQLATFYAQVAAEARKRGMKLAVESGAMFPGIYSAGSGLDAAPYFAKLSDAQYAAGRAAQVVTLADRMRPDVLNVGSEPDTESRLSGKAFVRSPQGFASMVGSVVDAVAAAGLSSVPLLAGTGTWDASGGTYVAELVKVPGLWGIDLHVYPVNHDFLPRLLSLAAQARAAGKRVTMLECWLQKIRDSELATIDSAFDSTVFARDSWSFWEPLDRRFFGAMVRAAHAARIDYVSPFWSRLFIGNLDYATVGATSPPPSSDELIQLATAAAGDALRAGRTTATGRGFAALVSGDPTELTVAKTVPIVLDVAGSGGAHYVTELVLANRGTTATRVDLVYTPATSLGASGGGRVTVDLPAGRQLVVTDTLAFLRERGLAIPSGSSQGGTLQATFRGLSSPDVAYAGARTTSLSGSGRAGLSYTGIAHHDAQTWTSFVYGLRTSAADRTNLALANTGDASTTLRVTLYSGEAGDYRSSVLSPDVALEPGQWKQLDRVLEGAGLVNGYARIDVVSGLGPYLAYAVFNDDVTNDGSYVPFEPGLRLSETRLVPVLVESAAFESELVLTNPTAATQTVTLSYVESFSPAGGAGGSVSLDLLPAEQRIVPRAIDVLRQKGIAIGPRGAATYAGSLLVEFRMGGASSSGFAGARTAAPAPAGGAYGLFSSATGSSWAATSEAWVYGLKQDSKSRSNLALSTWPGPGGAATFRADVFDGATGLLAGSTEVLSVAPGAWTQIDGILGRFGLSNGYVHLVRLSGASPFVAYGVVNDGESPGSGGTNDGSFVTMSTY